MSSLLRHRMSRLAIIAGMAVGVLMGSIVAWASFSSTSTAQGNSFSAAAVDHLSISPSSSSITTGGSQSYSVHALSVTNFDYGDVTAATSFSITPDGSCTGASCTASASGPHVVTASYWGVQVMASLNVAAADGAGTLTTPTTSVSANSTGNAITFTYTAATGGLSNGSITLAAPSGWSAPSTTGSAAGYTTSSPGTISTAGQTITVSGITLGSGATLTIVLRVQDIVRTGATVTSGQPALRPGRLRRSLPPAAHSQIWRLRPPLPSTPPTARGP